MNYATKVGNPTAHITKKKSRLKVYNGHIVFLNDKDNFEFELHNPTQKTVLCKIKLNGEYISVNGIVLRPGQRVFLERFLDTNNKFEFNTYKVKNTSENRSAIDLNGDVLIEFYEELSYRMYSGSSTLLVGNSNYTGNLNGYHNPTFTTTTQGFGHYSTLTTSSAPMVYYSNTSIGGTLTGIQTSNNFNSEKSIETGRVEKGKESNQSFTNSYESFNYFTSHTVKFKIQPINTKNVNFEEIRQYCTECGTKVKKNFKFCPSCGNKI